MKVIICFRKLFPLDAIAVSDILNSVQTKGALWFRSVMRAVI